MWIAAVALLAALFGPADPTPTHHSLSETSGLDYTEVVTGGAHPNAKLPLVVVLHGRGGGIAQLRRELERLGTPARIIVPRGPIRLEGGRRAWFREPVRHGESVTLVEAAEEAVDDLSGLLSDVRRARPTCGNAVVVGWSQGGVLAFLLALERPALLQQAIVVGGSVPDSLMPHTLEPHAPITALHGTRDTRVPFRHTRAVTRELRDMGFVVELRPYRDVAHELTGPMRRELRDMIEDTAETIGARCPARR